MFPESMMTDDKRSKVIEIAERLRRTKNGAEEHVTTATREEYDLLFEGIDAGWLPEDFQLGRSGMWVNKTRIYPPEPAVAQ